MTRHHLPKQDDRPRRNGWGPGNYGHFCCNCGEEFLGDKRAVQCCDCAYEAARRVAVIGAGVAGMALVHRLMERLEASPDLDVEIMDDGVRMAEAVKLRNTVPFKMPPPIELGTFVQRGGGFDCSGSRKKGGRRRWSVPK